ncbi:MAG: DNA primase, partial [Candidatus Omnitrophica bacterium]|nr:DNA primase [Candidatus Omnitrophota bacterium]
MSQETSHHIEENTLDGILNATDIVELISGYIPLKRAGRNFRANCPFHHEKTPSFMVSQDKQIYHCFGCGTGGNAFNFLMQYEKMEFLEAVNTLAQKACIVIPRKDTARADGLHATLYKINELAAEFYANNLQSPSGSYAKNYLLNRGLTDETIKLFKLGIASDRWNDLINNLRAKNISLGLLEKAGLILSKEKGGYYDRFRKRVIFPVWDVKSRAVAFGARVTDDTLPKYINSPETPIYIKGKNLYGLNFSKNEIRDKDCAIIVEGYLDFIIPYQHGLCNIVASLGTALTSDQIRLIKRYTNNIIMLYDGDTAGQMATLRTWDIFFEEGMNVRVASLPEQLDPDN